MEPAAREDRCDAVTRIRQYPLRWRQRAWLPVRFARKPSFRGGCCGALQRNRFLPFSRVRRWRARKLSIFFCHVLLRAKAAIMWLRMGSDVGFAVGVAVEGGAARVPQAPICSVAFRGPPGVPGPSQPGQPGGPSSKTLNHGLGALGGAIDTEATYPFCDDGEYFRLYGCRRRCPRVGRLALLVGARRWCIWAVNPSTQARHPARNESMSMPLTACVPDISLM